MIILHADKLPEMRTTEGRTTRNDVTKILQDFLATGWKYGIIIVEPDEYANGESERNALRSCIKNQELPLKVHLRDDRLYLSRTDIKTKNMRKKRRSK